MRNLGLDLLRLAAIALVLGRHLTLPADAGIFLQLWQRGGWVGVDLFFVLSGFLVSGLLYREHVRSGTIDIGRFLVRRAFKIYPAFYALLAFTVAFRIAAGLPLSPRGVAGELFFLQNYVGALWGHTWSLAVEEHFYALIALVTWTMARRARPADNPFDGIPTLFFAIAVACFAGRIATRAAGPMFSPADMMFSTHLRIDSLMFGVFLAFLWHFRGLKTASDRVPGWLLSGSGIALLSPAFLFSFDDSTAVIAYGAIPIYLGSGLLVLWAVRLAQTEAAWLRALGALGAASYSIYLWHLPVETWGWAAAKRFLATDAFGAYATFYLLGSLAIGFAMNRLIEGPALALRDRLFPAIRR